MKTKSEPKTYPEYPGRLSQIARMETLKYAPLMIALLTVLSVFMKSAGLEKLFFGQEQATVAELDEAVRQALNRVRAADPTAFFYFSIYSDTPTSHFALEIAEDGITHLALDYDSSDLVPEATDSFAYLNNLVSFFSQVRAQRSFVYFSLITTLTKDLTGDNCSPIEGLNGLIDFDITNNIENITIFLDCDGEERNLRFSLEPSETGDNMVLSGAVVGDDAVLADDSLRNYVQAMDSSGVAGVFPASVVELMESSANLANLAEN